MNRIFGALFAFTLLARSISAADLNDLQAGRVANVVGLILEKHHFRQARLDDTISNGFLTNYLNALDYNHMIFLQSDVDDFKAKYGSKLDDAIKAGQIAPAFRIYDTYLDRLMERNLLVQKLLKQEFNFSEDDNFIVARNKEPWPNDDVEAAKLWRQRVKFELLQGRLAKEKPEETIGLISRRYNRLEKIMTEMKRDEKLQMYLTSLAHSYDPHSDYMSPSEAANFDIQHISLSLTGIGAQLIWEDGYTKIKELIPGGPAAMSKQLRPGDKIIAVAQGSGEPVDVVEMRLNEVVEMIRGKKGTEVRLTVVPAKNRDSRKIISLVRDEIKFKEQFAKAKVYDYQDPDGFSQRIGVINLPQFYDGCASHVNTLIQRLKKENVQALVLDLRRNGGGILDEAVQLTGLFIKKGPVVQVKDPKRDAHVLEDKNSDIAWSGPLVVAVGKLSASASEIVAGALQDYGRAVLVGDESTHGKGTVQQVLSLDNIIPKSQVENPGKLKITVSKFYRVSGSTTQKQGVTPDIILPSIYDYLDIGEASLENCLPADQTTPANYNPVDMVKSYLTDLQSASKTRVGHSKDFAYVLEDIQETKKHKDEKIISLKESVRLKEKEDLKKRLEARKKERASRPPLTAAIYDLDMDMAEAGKPLEKYDPNKAKEDAEVAQATQATSDDPEADPDTETEAEAAFDPHLDETLQITRDYMNMFNKNLKPSVVLNPTPSLTKKSTATEQQAVGNP
ncbi:MAG TPA: carboxy terminal-processing peptidase [Verrucomicrobiae bacterium]|jgi:carboxyl-terminal processing protease|nr:carboxy terminal-processing peptidase [Verrucomicrobiae bacterium]